MSRVAILIDGSNFLAELDRCGLGYPALRPLISWIQGADALVYARFYSAPQLVEPFQSRWQSFRAANRHIVGGDADHHYAVKIARSMRRFVKVWLMPAQPSSNLALEKIAYHRMSVSDLVSRRIADRGAQASVPVAHRAPVGSVDVTPRFTGAFGRVI